MVCALSNDPRILFFSPDTGGTGIDGPLTNAINLARSFGDANLPGIFVYNGREEVFDRFVATGADVRRAPFPISSLKTHLNPIYRRRYSKILARYLRAEQIDVVHLFPRATYVLHYLEGINVFKVAQQPYSSPDLRPIRLFENGFSLRPRNLLNAWYRKYVRFSYSRADLVSGIGNSHRAASTKVFGIPEHKTAVVRPGITPQKQLANPGAVRREFGIACDVKIVLSVGRITRPKGVEEFGEIARLLHERGKTYRFLFAGYSFDDAYEANIRERYGQFVTFMGHRDDIPNCMEDSDLYLHPSHREGLPLAIMESMEFGLPAVAWDIPGCNELIVDGSTGALPEFGDVTAAANAIEELLDNPAAYEKSSAATVERFNERHKISEYAPRLMRIYKEAMARSERD